MGKLNTVSCKTFAINTGTGECDLHFSLEGVIEVPKSREFSQAEIEAMQTTLNAGVIAASKSNRFFPFPVLIGEETTGGDTNEVEFDNGISITTFENYYKVTGKFYKGGFGSNNALRSRNGNDIALLFYGKIGASYAILGAKINSKYKGIPGINFWCNPQKWGAFKRESQYMWKVNIPTPYLNDQLWYVTTDFYPADIEGLHHVEMEAVNSTTPISAGGVIEVYAKEKSYGTDYATNYATELTAIVLGSYTAKNTATGAAISVTARAIASGKITWTLDTADTDYPAVGGSITLVPPTVAQLTAANILLAEIQEYTFVRTV
jgi:hypothetical protein